MPLVKIQTTNEQGKKFYPIYEVLKLDVNGEVSWKAVRIYTYKDDAVGYNTLSMCAKYYPNVERIKDVVDYYATGDEKYLNTKKQEEKKVK